MSFLEENEKLKNKVDKIRHSTSHLLAYAVKELWPNAKLGIGPVVENGFYYDFDFGGTPISDNDLKKIEKKMRQLLNPAFTFEHTEVSITAALEKEKSEPFKSEIIADLEKAGEKEVGFYTSGKFEDLCRGPHVVSSKELGHFKLLKIAGAYWRGDEKKQQLTRIYGTAWASDRELQEYLQMLEEAKKRDHKKLGKELDLFVFSELVGPGLPLWTPKGTVLRDVLDGLVWQLRAEKGYQRVDIPHITKKDLYEKSGHWTKFSNELFHVSTREGHEFVLKPMNCPHHIQIFARKAWAYRELPQRYASTTKVYRDEQTGELQGLARVRSITQDDAHVFCRYSQMEKEISTIWSIVKKFYRALNLPIAYVRLSLSDQTQPDKYLGDRAVWDKAEDALRRAAKKENIATVEAEGEAAFYGPKLDFMAKDSLGREHQVATIQLDMNMPERFGLNCVNDKGEFERIVMIHAAIMGSIERLMAVAIEHYAGAFPLWLAPVQAKILPLSDKFNTYAKAVYEELREAGLRTELDDSNETLGKKIRNAEKEKIPYILILGEKEKKAKGVAVRKRGKGDIGLKKVSAFVKSALKEIAERK